LANLSTPQVGDPAPRGQGGALAAARSGPDLARWLARDAAVRQGVITDGRHSVSYADTARLLEELDGHFARGGVTRHQPLALECSQTVAGALAILYVLSREYDVVLLPELEETAKEAGTPRFIPSFCSHVVTARSAVAETVDSPLACIAIAVNQAFAAEPVVTAFTGPDLYLRTSGSTGIPKLARMSHQKWLDNAMACVERWELTAADRLAVPVPIFHSYGFGAAFLPGLLAGAAMDLGSGGNILRYLQREERFAPTVGFLTPALCDMFLTVRKSPRRYRLSVTAGDKIKRETTARFEPLFGPLLNLYGSAEMGAVSAAAAADPPETRLGTAGYPLGSIELRLTDAETMAGAEEEPGGAGAPGAERVGLLQCRQRYGFAGYLAWQDGWRFEPHGDDQWFTTGDLAKIRADGYLEILGRSGLSVKRDGLLVLFADVETAMEKVPGVERAVLVAAGESRRGSRLVGVCLVRPPAAAPQPEAVRRKCVELLPRYAVPDAVMVVASLPQLPSGKIDRRAIREQVVQAQASASPAPAGERNKDGATS
jgi:acyl-CoA synthetase (AMP-forming)/AMP-acid ligase II